MWKEKCDIARLTFLTKSMKMCIRRIRKICGFNGMGFRAKEIALDLKAVLDVSGITNYFCDYHYWSPVGPGARKGLERIFGTYKKKICEETYIDMLKDVHSYILDLKNTIPENMDYALYDTQFVLCEFNKYVRIMKREGGYYRKYKVFYI